MGVTLFLERGAEALIATLCQNIKEGDGGVARVATVYLIVVTCKVVRLL